MKIGLAGLGLIGGSYAKAIRKYTSHEIAGFDNNRKIIETAMEEGVIDCVLDNETIQECDVIIVSIYPQAAVEYIRSNAKRFKKGAVVTDTCGTKARLCAMIEEVARESGFDFIGGHPMAGIEQSGYNASFAELFQGASLVLTPYEWSSPAAVRNLSDLAEELGFGRIKMAAPSEHDEMIAYTSQLPHVVSCAFIGSSLSERFEGFSAGSFQDMTRVARLNETMWSELFIENRDYLGREIDGLIDRLISLKTQIVQADKVNLERSLRKYREMKEKTGEK